MRWLGTSRFARLAAAIFAVVTISGCPELNYWNGPTQDPFFSVPDPLVPPSGTGAGLNRPRAKPVLQTSVSTDAL